MKPKEGVDKIIESTDLFAAHVRSHPDVFPERDEVRVVGTGECALCGRHRDPLYDLHAILTPTFTDHDIWRNTTSNGVCESCKMVLQHGWHKKRLGWAFLAFGSEVRFPWDSYELPWYSIPKERPMFAVVPGRTYMQKHTIFRGQAIIDPAWIGIWHGDVGHMIYARQEAADEIHALEVEWQKDEYPSPKEVREAVRKVVSNHSLDRFLTDWAMRVLMTHRKNSNQEG